MKKLNDGLLFYLALYACIGIFGSFFTVIFEWKIFHSFWFSAILFTSGAIVATFNRIYEEKVEKPELRELLRGKYKEFGSDFKI